MGRIIFHIDMNSFFVSCEVAEHPELKGKEVAVAPDASERKSIILAASYEAKKKGIKTTMHVHEAMRLCPNIIFLDTNSRLYSEYSRRFFSYFLTITPLVEPASIDEGFLDVTDVCKDIDPLDLAKEMQSYILNNIGLPCSIGIGPNKLLAKMASDMKKPLGITVLRKREVSTKMWPLKVEDLQGVGKKTVKLLNELKIFTIGDLANFKDIKMLEQTVGKNNAKGLIYAANGNGNSVVDITRFNENQSISNSTTFDADQYDTDKVKKTLKVLTNSVCKRMENSKQKALTFTVQIKYNNFKSYSKSKTIDIAINDNEKVYQIMEDLFDDLVNYSLGIRLVGVAASKFKPYVEKQKQMTIFDKFDDDEEDQKINAIIRSINEQLGKEILQRGISLKEGTNFSKITKDYK